jgi:hypothetical protein
MGPSRMPKLLTVLFSAKTSTFAPDMALKFQTLPELHLRQTPSFPDRGLTVTMKPGQFHFTSLHLSYYKSLQFTSFHLLYNSLLYIISF